MIGGKDIIFHTSLNAGKLLQDICELIIQSWKEAIIEDAHTGEIINNFNGIESVFVYKDKKSASLWEEFGYSSEHKNTMIQIIVKSETMTIVIDEEDDFMRKIITDINVKILHV